MVDSEHLQNITWAITTVLELALLGLLVRKKVFLHYPFFSAYLISTILQSAAVAILYATPGLDKYEEWNIAWGTQAAVSVMRSLALVELTRKVLAAFQGIWGLAWRLLILVGMAALCYALLFSKGMSEWLIMGAVRGFELASAAVIVTMLLFARFYSLPLRPVQGALAAGFCLYSAFYVIDYSLLGKMVQKYAGLWKFLEILTFMASLLVWIRAASRYHAAEEEVAEASIPPEVYGRLSSEVNLRLHVLNRQLMQFFDTEDRQP